MSKYLISQGNVDSLRVIKKRVNKFQDGCKETTFIPIALPSLLFWLSVVIIKLRVIELNRIDPLLFKISC